MSWLYVAALIFVSIVAQISVRPRPNSNQNKKFQINLVKV
jgi:hypothetical protein